jgi:hypothetical protein
MKGEPRCTALKCAFEPGAGTVLVERATSAASAWGHVYVCCDLTRCDGALGGTVAAHSPSCFRFALIPFRADLVVPLGTRWEPAIARFAMLVN